MGAPALGPAEGAVLGLVGDELGAALGVGVVVGSLVPLLEPVSQPLPPMVPSLGKGLPGVVFSDPVLGRPELEPLPAFAPPLWCLAVSCFFFVAPDRCSVEETLVGVPADDADPESASSAGFALRSVFVFVKDSGSAGTMKESPGMGCFAGAG